MNHGKLIMKNLVTLFSIGVFAILVAISPQTAHAQTAHLQDFLITHSSHQPCQENWENKCYRPNVVQPAGCASPQPDQAQYYTDIDFYGNPIDWTNTNKFQTPCVTVEYNVLPVSGASSCSLYLYVPNKNANATVSWTVAQAGGVVGAGGTLSEAPVDGWQLLMNGFPANIAATLTFSDNNGEVNPSLKLGWGSSLQYSLSESCTPSV